MQYRVWYVLYGVCTMDLRVTRQSVARGEATRDVVDQWNACGGSAQNGQAKNGNGSFAGPGVHAYYYSVLRTPHTQFDAFVAPLYCLQQHRRYTLDYCVRTSIIRTGLSSEHGDEDCLSVQGLEVDCDQN